MIRPENSVAVLLKIENYFVNIIGVVKWFVKVALFGYPYLGRYLDYVYQTYVCGVGKGWLWCEIGGLH